MVINSSQALISELEFRSLFRGHSCPACYYYKQKLCTMQGCRIDNCLTNISCGCSKMCLFWPNRAQTTMHPCFCERHLSPAVPFLPAEQTLPLLYTPRSKHTRTNKSTLFSTECREKGASQRIHMAMPEPAQPGMFTSGTFQWEAIISSSQRST